MENNWKLETLAVQAGYTPGDGDARIAPIVQSTTYKYDNAQSVADLFDLKKAGFFYTRLANPTVDCFEKRIAALEGGVAAVALSSGQTANFSAIANIAKCGDHVVTIAALYGGTVSLFSNTLLWLPMPPLLKSKLLSDPIPKLSSAKRWLIPP